MSEKIIVYTGTHGRDPGKIGTLISRAARIKGQSISAFCLNAIERSASAVVRRDQKKKKRGGNEPSA